MVDIGITTISSKGQIVIPKELRKGFKKGDKLLLMRKDGMLSMRHAAKIEEQMAEDLVFARRTEEALKRYDRGEFKKLPADEFLRELDKW